MKTARAPGGRRAFPPGEIAQIKAVACELPSRYERPLSRLFVPDVVDIALTEGIVESISASTVWRILDRGHARQGRPHLRRRLTFGHLKPWRRRNWIYPRDPLFYERATPVKAGRTTEGA